MSADLLRQAAALMRERAEAATPSPWRYTGYISERANPGDGGGWIHAGTGIREHAVTVTLPYSPRPNEDAHHIVSWHPVVALAVADMLDLAAYFGPVNEAHNPDCHECSVAIRAEAIARAYLDEQP